MKKILFLLSLTFFINLTFSQVNSSTKPIILQYDETSDDYVPIASFTPIEIGCGIESVQVKATFSNFTSDTSTYRVEEIPFNPKGYLPEKPGGGAYYTPSELGVPGGMIPNDVDDRWYGPYSLSGINFDFCFFGEQRDMFEVSSNGIVSFHADPRSTGVSPNPLVGTGPYTNDGYSEWNLQGMGRIDPDANCGDNLDAIMSIHDTNPQPSFGNNLFDTYQFWAIVGPNEGERFFVLGEHHLPMYDCGQDVGFATHQFVFYETTSIIEFHIQDKPYCKTWGLPPGEPGLQAFGIQNEDQTIGIGVPGLDNHSAPVQILDLNDGFYDNNLDVNVAVTPPKSYRFIPDGPGGTAPTFKWYKTWTGDPATSTQAPITNPTNPEITITSDDIPVDYDTNGDPIFPATVTYTAVVTYVDYCSGNSIYGTSTVTFKLVNPTTMHIQEQDAEENDTIETELITEEEITICPGEDYTLTSIVKEANETRPYTLVWSYREGSGTEIELSTQSIDTDTSLPYDSIDYVIEQDVLSLLPGHTYKFTCTVTDDGGTAATASDDCIFSDTIIIHVLDIAYFEFEDNDNDGNGDTSFCANGPDPIPYLDQVPPIDAASIVPPLPTPLDSDFYFTVDNGGVWINPIPTPDPDDPADAVISLDGILDLSESVKKDPDHPEEDPVLNADGTASFTITYHGGCEENTKDVTIKIINPVASPLVHTVSDPPESTDIALILCETNTTNHTAVFDTSNWNSTILGSDQTGVRPDDSTIPLYTVVYTAFTVDTSTGVETPYPLPSDFPEDANGDLLATLPTLRIYAQVIYNDGTVQCDSQLVPFEIESNPSPLIDVPYTYIDNSDPNNEIYIIEMCEDDDDNDPDVHTAKFDTTNWETTILAGQSGFMPNGDPRYDVIYTAVDLNGDEVTLPDPFPNTTTNEFISPSIIITATVTDEYLPCDISKEFRLEVINNPVNNPIPDMIQCEDDTDPDSNVHTSTFSTADWTNTVLGILDTDPHPAGIIVEYSYKLEDGTNVTKVDTGNAATTTLDPSIISSSQTVTVVVRKEGYVLNCETPDATATSAIEFNLVVINTPTYVVQQDITKCEAVNTDPNIHQYGFDTTGWDASILGTQVDPKFSVIYTAFTIDPVTNNEVAYTLPNPLPDILDVPSLTIRYVVRYTIDEDDNIYCESQTPSNNPNQNTFDLIVRLIPNVQLLEDDMDTKELVDLKGCENDTDPDPDVHTADFNTKNWYRAILPDNYDETATPPIINPDYIIEFTYVDEFGIEQTVEFSNLPETLALSPQTIKYRAFNRTTGKDTCYSEELEFEVVVGLLPVGIDTPGTAIVCSGSKNYITLDDSTTTPPTYKPFIFDDFATFTDTGNGNRNTYKWKATTDNLDVTGESLVYVDNDDIDKPTITDKLINLSQVVQYVTYEVIPISEYGCEGLPLYFTIQVDVAPNMTDQNTIICNEEQVDIYFDDYTSLTDNTYLWHAIENNNVEGETTSDMETSTIDDTIINISGVAQIVEYVVIPKSVGGCEGTPFSVFVTIDPRPDFILKPQYFICPEIGSVLIGEDSNPDTYTYYWFESNDLNNEIDLDHPKQYEVKESDLASSNGNYVLTVEDNFTHCTYSQFTTVSMAEQMAIASIHVSDFNAPDNTITITMVGGTGAYEYTLHYVDSNGMSQSITQNSPVFENLDANTYQIEVTDLNNCSVTIFSNDIYVLDYPSFFTPNGDGENDTWSIVGANIIPNSKIYIFDRFGKVLAKVNPNSVLGWDGTYNGVPVPEDDYWFTTEYVDPNTGKPKTVKGHFSIVREK